MSAIAVLSRKTAPEISVRLGFPGGISREPNTIGGHIGEAKSVGFGFLAVKFGFHVEFPIFIEVFHGK